MDVGNIRIYSGGPGAKLHDRVGEECEVLAVYDYGVRVKFSSDGFTTQVGPSLLVRLVEFQGLEAAFDTPSPAKPAHDGKLDNGKVDPGMLYRGCANGLEAVLGVLEFGAKKYAADSWQTVPNAVARYRAAMDRHKMEIDKHGLYAVDAETGKLHLAHIATNILFLLEFKHKEDNAST